MDVSKAADVSPGTGLTHVAIAGSEGSHLVRQRLSSSIWQQTTEVGIKERLATNVVMLIKIAARRVRHVNKRSR